MIIYNNKNIKVLDVTVDDNSYRYRVIKGDHNLTLHYSLAEHVEIPVGSYCIYQGERYTLERPEAFKMKHSRNFEYTVTLESNQAKAKKPLGHFGLLHPVDPVGGKKVVLETHEMEGSAHGDLRQIEPG